MARSGEHIPTVMPTKNRPQTRGVSLDDETSRLEAVAKVTGAARYGRDMYLPNSLFVGFVRCPVGRGSLLSMDTDAARKVPGVVEVERFGDEGKYQGQPVGYVAAESPHALRRGLRALSPRWRVRSSDTRISDVAKEPPAVGGEAQQRLRKAAHVLQAVYSTEVQTHSSAETHGSVVDHRGDSATVYASTQGTFASLDGLDEAFGIPLSEVEVRCEHVGGGFGSKLRAGKESQWAGRVGAKHRRPVYLFLDRAEEHVDTGNRPSSRTHVDIGFEADGTIVGGRVRTYGGVGVAGNGRVWFPSGRYELGEIEKDHESVRINGCAERPFRAPGGPQGAFAEEMMLDEVATIAGVDPLELRMRLAANDDFREMFRMGAERIGWERRVATGSQKGVIRRGFGMGATSWGRYPARAEAEVVINADGSVEARTGTQDIGTGQRTVMAVVVADGIGIPLERVQVRLGSSKLPVGPASGGSMTVHNTAPAMMMAAAEARETLLEKIGGRVGAPAGELRIVDGEIRRNGDAVMGWDEACRLVAGSSITGRGDRAAGVETYGGEGHSFGAQFAEVSVDSETGVVRVDRVVAVQACGQVLCRKTAESQIIGGVTQGVSYALFEERVLDRNVGAMLNANLETYKTAGARDIPRIEPMFYTKGQTGPRSLGEPPTIPTAGAIACAVYNAIGAPVRALPLTPDRVLAAMEGGER